MGGAKDKKAKETQKTESPDLPQGGAAGETTPTEVLGKSEEESKAVIQEQAEAPGSSATSKGKAGWGRNFLSLKKLQRRSRDESEEEKASSSKSGSQKSSVDKDDVPVTAPLAEEEPITPDGPPPGCSFLSAVGIRTPSKSSDSAKTSKSGSRKTGEDKGVKSPKPEAGKSDKEENLQSTEPESRKTEENVVSPELDSQLTGEEAIDERRKEVPEKTRESIQDEASVSGEDKDEDKAAKSGCSFLNAMGIRSPIKGSGEKNVKSSKSDIRKASTEEKPSQAPVDRSVQAGNVLTVVQDQELVSPDPASAGCSFLNVVGLGSSRKGIDKKPQEITGDEKSPPSKHDEHELAPITSRDRQNTLSDEDFTFSDESDGLTTARDALKKLSLAEKNKSPTSMLSGSAEDATPVFRSAITTMSICSDREISSAFCERHIVDQRVDMSSESEEHALSSRSGQFRTSGDADNEETTSGDALPKLSARTQHSNPKHPGRKYQASSRLHAQQDGRTSSESEETEGLQGSDSVFYTDKSESSHRPSEDTDEYALDFMESRKEEDGTSTQISLPFPRPLPKVIEDVAMGPGGRFTDDYSPSSGSSSLVSKSGNKIIIASNQGLSTERLISSSSASETEELVPAATQSEGFESQSGAPKQSATGAQSAEEPVPSIGSQSGKAQCLGEIHGRLPPEGSASNSKEVLSPGDASHSEGLISPDGTATYSEGNLSPDGTATYSGGLLSPEGTATFSGGLLSPERTATHSGGILSPEGTVSHSEGILSPAGTATHSEGILSPAGTTTHSEGILSPVGTATEADDEGLSEDSKDLTDSDPRSHRQGTPGDQGQEASSRFLAQSPETEEVPTQGMSELGVAAFGRSDSLRTITEENTPQDSPVDEQSSSRDDDSARDTNQQHI